MAFAKDMVRVKNQLAKMGHQANLPHGTEPHLKDKEFVDKLDDNYEYCIKNNIMKKCFDQVAESDAVLFKFRKKRNIGVYRSFCINGNGSCSSFKKKDFFI